MSQAPRAAGKWKTANGYSTGSGVDRDAIGIFDSGVGGLTASTGSSELLPAENLIYLGDTGRAPTATSSPRPSRSYSHRERGSFLVESGRQDAGRRLQRRMSAWHSTRCAPNAAFRSSGSSSPARRRRPQCTRNRRVGVIGTEATIASGAYTRAIKRLRRELSRFPTRRACPLFVPLAEEGWTDNDVARVTVATYLGACRQRHRHADPRLHPLPAARRSRSRFPRGRVRLVDSAEETAREVRETFADAAAPPRRRRRHDFFVTDVPGPLHQSGPELSRRARRVALGSNDERDRADGGGGPDRRDRVARTPSAGPVGEEPPRLRRAIFSKHLFVPRMSRPAVARLRELLPRRERRVRL